MRLLLYVLLAVGCITTVLALSGAAPTGAILDVSPMWNAKRLKAVKAGGEEALARVDEVIRGEQQRRELKHMHKRYQSATSVSQLCEAANPSINVGAPGALIEVTITGTVGILLVDVPNVTHNGFNERDETASLFLNKKDNWYDAKVRLLSHYTDYLLHFAQYFFEDLKYVSLPDDQQFEITYTGLPRRELFVSPSTEPLDPQAEPLDAIVRDYIIKVVIVTTTDSPAKMSSQLAAINGTFETVMDLPLDPTNFIQRTGKACLVESNYPEGSEHQLMPYSLYLPICGIEEGIFTKPANATERACFYCHCYDPIPTIPCTRALELRTGRVPTTVTLKHIEYVEEIANQWRFYPAGPPTEGADLVPYTKDFQQVYQTYRYATLDSAELAENCYSQAGWAQLVEYSSNDMNNGKKAMVVGKIDYNFDTSAPLPPFQNEGMFVRSNPHGHYHFGAYAEQIITAHGYLDSANIKRGFCLVQSKRVRNDETSPMENPYTACDNQGIGPGGCDMYQAGIPCQWKVITNAPDKKLTLGCKINRWDALCEGDIQCDASTGNVITEPSGLISCLPDNSSVCESFNKSVCVHLEGELDYLDNNLEEVTFNKAQCGEGYLTEPISQYGIDQEIGNLRDVEYSLFGAQLRSCSTPGANFTISCSIPVANNITKQRSEVVRVCESSVHLGCGTACFWGREGFIDDLIVTPSSGTVTKVMKCPAARDGGVTGEPGGFVTTYRANVVATLGKKKNGQVECTIS